MTEDTAKRPIDWLHGTGCRVLAYMGGEPLLRPDLIHPITYYAAKKNFWIYLPTNARLLRTDVIDKLADAGILIRPPGSSIITLSTAPMSDKLVPLLATQPNVAMAIGTVVQPLEGLDTVTDLDLDQFSKMSGGFHFLEGGPFQKDDDILIDEFYARQKGLRAEDTLHLIGHDWHVTGVLESGKLARICVRLPVLQQLTGNPNHLSQIYLKIDNPGHTQSVINELHKLLRDIRFIPSKNLLHYYQSIASA
jgi:hypothetical protein